MPFRKLVHPIAAVLTCGWILLSNSMPCVAAPSCDGAIFLRTEGPYKYGQEVAVRVIISPETPYSDGVVQVFSGDDKRYRVRAENLGDGVWDAKIRIPVLNTWNRKIGFKVWKGGEILCEKSKTIDMKADLVMDLQGPEWSCEGYPAEYEVTVGGDASMISVHWDFGQEERSTTLISQGRDLQRIRWKTPGEKTVIATIKAWGHPLQSRQIPTRVAPEKAGLVVEGPPTVQLGDLKEWTIVVPPMGPGHRIYHMELEVDWGQGETSRYVNRNNRFEIGKRFVRPGTYTVGLRLLERNVSPLLENKFIVKVIENRPTLDLQVTGPEQVTAGTPAFWTARTTRGRPPYKFSVEPWYDKKRTLLSDSNVGKFNLNLSTPGKNKLVFQVVDVDGIASYWHYVNVLVTPEKNEATVVNVTQGGNTSTIGGTMKKDPSPDGGQQNGSGSGATPVGDPTGSPDIYGGLVIKGPARLSVKASALLKALDHGGRAYASATWDSSNTEVLRVSANGAVEGLKTGHATVFVHVDDMRAYHDIEVVKGPVDPFQDAVDDLKKDPNVKVVVKKPLPDGEDADEQGIDTGSDNGDSQSSDVDDGSDDLDSIEIGGVSVDSDDEDDSEDDMGFKKIGRKHESGNEGGLDLFGVSTDPSATALADPYDLTGTWHLVNSYYTCENPGATRISPAWAQKSAVVRIEPKKDRYVGKIVRNGELPGIESHWNKDTNRWRKGQEVLWVERKGKDTYEGQIRQNSKVPYRRYVIFKVEGKRARICAHDSEYLCQGLINSNGSALGFRISSGDNVGRYKRTPESDSINVFGTEVGD